MIDPANFSPFPKNPVIARFFKEIGWADELGSGIRNLFKYCKKYSGKEPQLIEEDIFKTIIPFTDQASDQDEKEIKVIEFCKTEKSANEIMNFLGLKHKQHFRSQILNPLIEKGLIGLTIPDKLNSPKQKYYSKQTIK